MGLLSGIRDFAFGGGGKAGSSSSSSTNQSQSDSQGTSFNGANSFGSSFSDGANQGTSFNEGGSQGSRFGASTGDTSSFVNQQQMPYLQQMWDQAQNGGSTFANVNPYQTAGWGMGANAAANSNSLFGKMSQANDYLANPNIMFNNPNLMAATDYAAEGLNDQFRDTMGSLRNEGVAAGQWTTNKGEGTYNKGLQKAANPFARAMSGLYTNMGNNAYNQGMDSMNNAVNRMPAISDLGFAGAGAMQGMGNEMRGIESEQLMNPWQTMNMQKDIYGNPIMESMGSNTSLNGSENLGYSTGGSQNTGYNTGGSLNTSNSYGGSQNTSTSSSSGSSTSSGTGATPATNGIFAPIQLGGAKKF